MFASLITLLAIQSATAGDITVVGSLTREFSPALGSTTSDTISVRNDGSEPKDVLLYQVDYQYDAAGTNSFPSPGTLPRSNAPWVKVGAQQIRLDPGETEDVPYTLTVPSVVPVGGTQWSVIMIEPVTSRFDGERPTSDRAVTLNTIFRSAVQVVTQVGDGETKVAFRERALVRDGDQRAVRLDVENIGDRWFAPHVWLELFDPGGTSIGTFRATDRRLLPGCAARYWMDLSTVQAGDYTALIVADGGESGVFGTRLALKL